MRKKGDKKGVAIFVVLFVMMVLGTLMFSFHMSTRQAQSSVHRFQTSEMARQLAAAAQEEAFKYLYDKTANPASAEGQKIIQRTGIDMSANGGMDNRSSIGFIDLEIPATKELAVEMLGDRMELEAKARIVDFRNSDYHGRLFYGNEGIGTIEIAVRVKPKDQYKKNFPGACTIIRHHDYKVVSILSNKDNRENAYVGNSCLDYALFIRNGQYEFEGSPLALNPDKTSLEINVGDTPARVNLGSGGNQYTYLNISDDTKDFIPMPQNAQVNTAIEIPELLATGLEVDLFYPYFRQQIKKAANDEGASLDRLVGHKAKFEYIRKPITDNNFTDNESKGIRSIAAADAHNLGKKLAVSSNDEIAFYPSIKIEPKNKILDALDSDIRKSFMNIGYFKLDLSECEITVSADGDSKTLKVPVDSPQLIEQYKAVKLYCFDKDYHITNNPADENGINLQRLKQFVNNKGADIASKAFTYISDEYAYGEGIESSPNTTKFYTPRMEIKDFPSQSYHPYAHFNLWNKRNLTASELVSLGIYNKEENELYLRGVNHCIESITLGDPSKELKVYGSGVIIAKGNITIEGSIKKDNPQDVCVLFARDGGIRIKTDKEIQAALIAMGKGSLNSDIIVDSCLNLSGSIATDYLRLTKWKNDVTHKINYDEALAPKRDIYQINFAKWITFERVIENE